MSKFTGQNVIIVLETIFSRVQCAQRIVLCFACVFERAFFCFGSTFFPAIVHLICLGGFVVNLSPFLARVRQVRFAREFFTFVNLSSKRILIVRVVAGCRGLRSIVEAINGMRSR